MSKITFAKMLLPLLWRSISLTVRIKIGQACRWIKSPRLGAQLSVKDFSLDHLRGRYYVNTGKNTIHIAPDMAFAADLKAGGQDLVNKIVLPPNSHFWSKNNYIVITTSDGRPAETRICFDHAELKKVKRELRLSRKRVV